MQMAQRLLGLAFWFSKPRRKPRMQDLRILPFVMTVTPELDNSKIAVLNVATPLLEKLAVLDC